jgi:hypothetical protein
MSVKDRWVGPVEQTLNVPIACRWYGPGKPSSLLSIDVWLSPLLHWLAQERKWVRTRGSVIWRAMDYVGSPFSQERWVYSTLSMTHERLLYVDHMRYVWSRAIRGPDVESLWRVGWVFPCRVNIDSNHRDTQIWVTAYSWQSSHSKLME